VIRRILRISAWILGSVVALSVAAYGILVAINWRDQAPSDAALRLTKAYLERPRIADEDNAFVYVMGFGVAPGESPQIMGARRIAWMHQTAAETPGNAQGDPLGTPPDIRKHRHATLKQFVEDCTPRGSDCDDEFLNSADVFERWIAAEPWLLERYQALIAHAGWQETVPFDVSLPLPSYGLVAHGQQLLLMRARFLAHQGDHAAVRKLLEDDIRFWRGVLKSSDLLLTKMMATSALRRHFRWGNLVLREFENSAAPLAMPSEWDAEMTDAERSMRRCLAGEWLFTSELLRRGHAEYWDDPATKWWQKPFKRAAAPLYLQQDTINATALIFEAQGPLLDAPFADYESAMRHASATIQRLQTEVEPANSPYNLVGNFGVWTGDFDFTSYSRRVNDIEGIRRAAVTTVRLRAQRVQIDQVASALTTTPLRNPYDNQPFAWDAEKGAIVFVGTEHTQYGTHLFRY
jgi:hypothetical protein